MIEELTALSVAYIVISYISLTLFLGGFIYKLYLFATTPSPLKIPLAPQSTTARGLILSNFTKFAAFSILFKSNRLIWVGGFFLHLSLLLVFMHHLRLVIGFEVSSLSDFGVLAGFFLPIPLLYILISKMVVDRFRYITSPVDILVLLLMLLTALSGIFLNHSSEADTFLVSRFLNGLVLLNYSNIPNNLYFLFHFSSVLLLFALFPFTSLVHSGAIFFSPTLMQVDDARERRYINSMEIDDGW